MTSSHVLNANEQKRQKTNHKSRYLYMNRPWFGLLFLSFVTQPYHCSSFDDLCIRFTNLRWKALGDCVSSGTYEKVTKSQVNTVRGKTILGVGVGGRG